MTLNSVYTKIRTPFSLGLEKTPSVDLIKMLDSGSSITPTRQLGVVRTEENSMVDCSRK